jgi:hypothetical protein
MQVVNDNLTAAASPMERRERVLDPLARTSEVLFGVIMALTFTGTLSVATAGREEVRTLLVGIIGCNIAWGLVDGVMFLMSALTERGRGILTVRAVRDAVTAQEAHAAIAGAVPPVMASILTHEDFERLRLGLTQLRGLPDKPRLTGRDWTGAVVVFLLVFLSTFPIVIPFIVFDRVHVAVRVSNLIAILMMFVAGYRLAAYGGVHQVRAGVSVALLGVVLVAIAIALGG